MTDYGKEQRDSALQIQKEGGNADVDRVLKEGNKQGDQVLPLLTEYFEVEWYNSIYPTCLNMSHFTYIIWLLQNHVEANFDLFRYLLLGDQ